MQFGNNDLEMLYALKLAEIRRKDNSDMEAHETKAHTFYGPAIKINKLLNRLDGEWASKLSAVVAAPVAPPEPYRGFKYTMEELKAAVTAWASIDITDAEYDDMMARLGFEHRSENAYDSRKMMLMKLGAGGGTGKADKTTKVASGHIDRLMKAAFGIQYLPKLKGERGYRVIDFSPYTRLARFKAMFSSYSFIDDEDPLDDLLEPR